MDWDELWDQAWQKKIPVNMENINISYAKMSEEKIKDQRRKISWA